MASVTGVSKEALIRCGVAMLLEASDRRLRAASLPVFRSGRSRDVGEIRDDICRQIEQRSGRR